MFVQLLLEKMVLIDNGCVINDLKNEDKFKFSIIGDKKIQ